MGREVAYGIEHSDWRLETVFEAKREEFVDDTLIYAKGLCEELYIFLLSPQDESGGSIYLATEVKMFTYRTKMT
ncbi:hypothetical protein TNCV_2639151 [Trichonephila clavipes]|nr:hypothetical protein TNCV_2639151 [Trichonephila clavipes]